MPLLVIYAICLHNKLTILEVFAVHNLSIN